MAPAVIRKVYPDSTAHQMGIVAGDTITSVNSKSPRDVIDYRFEVSADFVTLLVSHADGTSTLFEIEKEYDDTLGIEFCDDVFD